MNLKIIKFGIIALLVSLGQAGEFQKVGTTGFVFLELPVTARYMSMGESGISMPFSAVEGLFVNPALITFSEQKTAAIISYSEWYVETSHQALGIVRDLGSIGTIGLQVVYFDFGEMQRTRNPGINDYGSYVNLGTFTASAYSLGFSYAKKLTDNFSFGTTVKYVRETIDVYFADNFITDIGFIYFTGYKGLRIGTFLQNFGLESVYADEKFRMPQQLKMGISGEIWGNYQSPYHLTLITEAIHPSNARERIHTGAELMISGALLIRGGYKFGYDEENWTAGIGLKFEYVAKQFNLVLGYMPHKHLGSTYRYSLSMEL